MSARPLQGKHRQRQPLRGASGSASGGMKVRRQKLRLTFPAPHSGPADMKFFTLALSSLALAAGQPPSEEACFESLVESCLDVSCLYDRTFGVHPHAPWRTRGFPAVAVWGHHSPPGSHNGVLCRTSRVIGGVACPKSAESPLMSAARVGDRRTTTLFVGRRLVPAGGVCVLDFRSRDSRATCLGAHASR